MKKHLTLLICLFVSIIFFSCKSDEGDPVSLDDRDPADFQIVIQNQFVSNPNKVSIFYRVVDGLDNPVSGLTEDDFTILEKGRNDVEFKLISVDEADRTISDNKDIFRNNVVLLLDLSGSVINNDLEALKISAELFVTNLLSTQNNSTKIGIYWFDGVDILHELVGPTDNLPLLVQAIEGMNQNISSDSSTDLFGAIIKGTAKAETALAENLASGFQAAASVITFTDGTDQAARHRREDAFQVVQVASNNIDFYTIGLGSEIDQVVLDALGPKSSLSTDDPDDLSNQFRAISDNIFNEANSFYLFEYCTPKRDGSGINGLRIDVQTPNGKGSVSTTFDATGFESGECGLF